MKVGALRLFLPLLVPLEEKQGVILPRRRDYKEAFCSSAVRTASCFVWLPRWIFSCKV